MDDGAPTEIPDDPRVLRLDDLLADAPPVRFSVDRRERGGGDVLHVAARPAAPRASSTRTVRSTCTRCPGPTPPAASRCSERDRVLPVVPMFHANAWGFAQSPLFAGAELVLPGPQMAPDKIAAMLEEEKVTLTAGVPTIWMGMLRRAGRARPVRAAHHPLRRVRGAEGAVRGLPGQDRPADPARLGDDRDQPARLDQLHAQRVRRDERGRPGRRPGPAGHPTGRRGGPDRRARARSPSCPGTTRPPASCRSAGRGSRGRTTATTAARSPSPRTAGCAPATSARSTSTATSGCPTAPRTWSSPAASGSARWSWRTT